MTAEQPAALLLFLKYPEVGKVKSRLAQGIGTDSALSVYEESLRLVLGNVRQVESRAVPIIFCDPLNRCDDMARLWSPGWPVRPQVGADLGERMEEASRWVFDAGGFGSVLFLGGDSPTLPVAYISEAIEAARRGPLCVGPSRDGGYWCIGHNRHEPRLFRGISWGSDRVFRETLAAAAGSGLSPILLPEWYDIDTLKDLDTAHEDLRTLPGGGRLCALIESIRGRTI